MADKKPKITLIWTLYANNVKGPFVNLSITYLSKVLEQNDFEVKCLDCNIVAYKKWGYENVNSKNQEEILSRLIKETEKTDPDIIAIGFWTEGASFVKPFVKAFKERNPGVDIILGGHLATFLPEKVLEFIPEADFLVRGEGEITLLELVKSISAGNKRPKIDGISYRDSKGNVINMPSRPLIKNLDELPLIDLENFTYVEKFEGVQMVSSRGCPCNCSYCSASSLYNCYRFHSPEYVLKQVKHFTELYDLKHIIFSEENVLYNQERVKKLFGSLAKENFDCKFPASGRADNINHDVIAILKKAKVPWLTIGVENIVPKVLRLYNRTNNPLKYILSVLKSARLIEENKIGAAFSFILGSPIETEADMLKNLNLMERLHKKDFWIYVGTLRLIPNSSFWFKYLNKEVEIFNLNRNLEFSFDEPYSDIEWLCPTNFAFKNDHYSNDKFVDICNKVMAKTRKFKSSPD